MRVLNKHKDEWPRDAVNIMRPSIFGNPFFVGVGGSGRDDAVDRHMVYAKHRIEIDPAFKAAVIGLKGHDLMCCCAPLRCHGDNLKLLCEEMPA